MDPQKKSVCLLPREAGRDFLFITILFWIAVILAKPLGDFPLNDDWSYGIAVKRFLESGGYYPTVWTSMSLISQVVWGATFAGLLGFSFETLRLSTMVLSWLGIFSIYLVVRQLKQPSWVALATSLTIAFNPIYFALSNTFMTDVPFMALSAMSMLFFVCNLQSHQWSSLFMGTLFAIIAVLCRQNALFVPLAFAITILVKEGIGHLPIFRALFPLILSLSVLFSFQWWMDKAGRTPELYGKQIGDLMAIISRPSVWPQNVGLNAGICILYTGLFLFPLLMYLVLSQKKVLPWLTKVVFPLALLATLLMAYAGRLMPVKTSILNASGIGPLSLHDTYLLNMPHVPELSAFFWRIISFVSVVGTILLLWFLFPLVIDIIVKIYQAVLTKKKRPVADGIPLFFLSGAAIYFGPILFVGFYDRYLLMLMLLLAFALFSYTGRLQLPFTKIMVVAIFFILPMAVFSIAVTHDYFSWNRARWKALREFTEKENIPASRINGGFEFNGYTLFNNTTFSEEEDLWWEEEDDLYMVTFDRLPDYEVVDYYPYTSWIPPYQGNILILKGEKKLSLDNSTSKN